MKCSSRTYRDIFSWELCSVLYCTAAPVRTDFGRTHDPLCESRALPSSPRLGLLASRSSVRPGRRSSRSDVLNTGNLTAFWSSIRSERLKYCTVHEAFSCVPLFLKLCIYCTSVLTDSVRVAMLNHHSRASSHHCVQ